MYTPVNEPGLEAFKQVFRGRLTSPLLGSITHSHLLVPGSSCRHDNHFVAHPGVSSRVDLALYARCPLWVLLLFGLHGIRRHFGRLYTTQLPRPLVRDDRYNVDLDHDG
jgi:hypothetical protein